MLAYILALAVGIGSLAIYLAAFFFPEIHRKNDFILSGIGLFYALVLWVFTPRITGGLLLGHIASVALLWWFGWQTLALRRQLTPQAQQTQVPNSELVKTSIQQQVDKLSLQQRLVQLQRGIGSTFSGVKDKAQKAGSKTTAATPKPEDITSVLMEESAVEIIDNTTSVTENPVNTDTDAIPPNSSSAELVEATPADTVEEIAPDAVLAPPTEAE